MCAIMIYNITWIKRQASDWINRKKLDTNRYFVFKLRKSSETERMPLRDIGSDNNEGPQPFNYEGPLVFIEQHILRHWLGQQRGICIFMKSNFRQNFSWDPSPSIMKALQSFIKQHIVSGHRRGFLMLSLQKFYCKFGTNKKFMRLIKVKRHASFMISNGYRMKFHVWIV